jgi:hypothetical protein
MILMSEKMTSQNKLYEIKLVPYNKPLNHGRKQRAQMKTAALWLLEGITTGFTIFPSFIALVHKNLLYVECTRYNCNILLIYVQVQ